MTGPMPQLPGVQFGNTPLDISSAVNSFAKGLQEARAQRRKEQMDQAMLGIQFMNAQGRLGEMGNMNMQRHLDDLRSKGIYVDPGQPMYDTDWAKLIEIGQQRSQQIRDWELLSPQARQFNQDKWNTLTPEQQALPENAMYQQPSREINTPTMSGQGNIRASVFVDPAHIREWQMQKQDERGRWANQIREAYLELARQKFAFQRAQPREGERAVAAGAQNMLEAHRDLRSIEMNWPQSANFAGMVKVLLNSTLGKHLPEMIGDLPQGSIEQRYTIAMHRWLSEFFPAKAGKVLTENEIKTYFPMLFARGFTDPETFDEINRAREGALRQVFFQSGPALMSAIRGGLINAGDIPPQLLQEYTTMYGTGADPRSPMGPQDPGNPTPSPTANDDEELRRRAEARRRARQGKP